MAKIFNGIPAEILLVEDNEGDALLTREALADGKFNNRISHVRDGVEAMRFLRKEGEYSDAPRPDLILLDLNMPRKDGRGVLHDVKHDAALRSIPIIVLTTSDSDRDIVQSYTQQASCYISKPVEFDTFLEVVHSIENFWLSIVNLPDVNAA